MSFVQENTIQNVICKTHAICSGLNVLRVMAKANIASAMKLGFLLQCRVPTDVFPYKVVVDTYNIGPKIQKLP